MMIHAQVHQIFGAAGRGQSQHQSDAEPDGLTSGLTFLTVLSLYIFGGQVLRGFSFALVVGIIIGTYSSIAVAAPMLVAWQEWRTQQGKTVVLPAAKRARM